MKKTYLTINEFKDRIEVSANIKGEPLEEKVLNTNIKQIARLIKKNNRKKKDIIINTNLDLEKDETEDNQKLTLISALNACKIKDKNQRLEYIYLAACKYLDNAFAINNVCEFCNDICLEGRKYNKKNGCCHEYKLKNLFSLKEIPLCRYLIDKKCIADCLGCKLFTCNTVHKKGIKYTYYNVALVRYFFNFGQKIIIRYSLFTHKNIILKRLKVINF